MDTPYDYRREVEQPTPIVERCLSDAQRIDNVIAGLRGLLGDGSTPLLYALIAASKTLREVAERGVRGKDRV